VEETLLVHLPSEDVADLLGELSAVDVVLFKISKVVDPGALDDCRDNTSTVVSWLGTRSGRQEGGLLTLHHHHAFLSEQHLRHDQRAARQVGEVFGAPRSVRGFVTCDQNA